MMSTTEITCACGCGRKKQVRTADVKRGWGKDYLSIRHNKILIDTNNLNFVQRCSLKTS